MPDMPSNALNTVAWASRLIIALVMGFVSMLAVVVILATAYEERFDPDSTRLVAWIPSHGGESRLHSTYTDGLGFTSVHIAIGLGAATWESPGYIDKVDDYLAQLPAWIARRRLVEESFQAETQPWGREVRGHGWPCRAFYCVIDEDLSSQSATPQIRGGIALDGRIPFVVPLTPIWGGVLANTLIFTPLWYLLLWVASACRQATRFRRGLCPVCKYDLLYDNRRGCPECGWRK